MRGVANLRRPTATARPARPRKPATHHRPAGADNSIPGIPTFLSPQYRQTTGGPTRLVLIAAGGNDGVQANRRRQMRCGSPDHDALRSVIRAARLDRNGFLNYPRSCDTTIRATGYR